MKQKSISFTYSVVVAVLAVIAIIAYLAFSIPSPTQKGEISTDQILQQGWLPEWPETIEKNLTDDRIVRFNENIDSAQLKIDEDQENAEAWNDLGFAKMQLGEVHGAYDAFIKSFEIIENQFPTWNNMGVLFEQIGALPEAEASYLRMVELQPDVIRTLSLINFYDKYSQYNTQQEELLMKITSSDRPKREYLMKLGQFYEKSSEYIKAIQTYQKVVALYPNQAKNTQVIIDTIKRQQGL